MESCSSLFFNWRKIKIMSRDCNFKVKIKKGRVNSKGVARTLFTPPTNFLDTPLWRNDNHHQYSNWTIYIKVIFFWEITNRFSKWIIKWVQPQIKHFIIMYFLGKKGERKSGLWIGNHGVRKISSSSASRYLLPHYT